MDQLFGEIQQELQDVLEMIVRNAFVPDKARAKISISLRKMNELHTRVQNAEMQLANAGKDIENEQLVTHPIHNSNT